MRSRIAMQPPQKNKKINGTTSVSSTGIYNQREACIRGWSLEHKPDRRQAALFSGDVGARFLPGPEKLPTIISNHSLSCATSHD